MDDCRQIYGIVSGKNSTPEFTIDNPQLSGLNSDPTSAGKQSSEAVAAMLPDAVMQFVTAATAENTRRAYQGDLADFMQWGGRVPCGPEVLAAYVAERAERHSPHTITRRVVGIGRAHTSLGFPNPAKNDLVRTVLRGVRRQNGRPQRQVAPLLKQDVLAVLATMKGTKGIRDRALILLGFAAALRRSELVALDVNDLAFVNAGLLVSLRKTKTDQEAEGRKIAVPYGRTSACAVKAIQQWITHAGISAGPLFTSIRKGGRIQPGRLTDQSVALIVKEYGAKVGLPASDMAGHSLRAGLVTSAAQAGASTPKIQQQTGHRSVEMVSRYIRDAGLFENNAAGLVL